MEVSSGLRALHTLYNHGQAIGKMHDLNVEKKRAFSPSLLLSLQLFACMHACMHACILQIEMSHGVQGRGDGKSTHLCAIVASLLFTDPVCHFTVPHT